MDSGSASTDPHQPPYPPSHHHYNEHRNSPLGLSPEELRVLRECSREASVYRAVPLAAVFSTATYLAIYKGYLQRGPRTGAFGKVFGAAMVGYMVGKFSYQSVCREKLLALPDSKLARVIRQSTATTGGLPQRTVDELSSSDDAIDDVFTKIPDKPIFDDHKPDERDRNEGLDEYQRVTDSLSEYTQASDPGDATTPARALTYEERRSLNREEYHSRQADRFRRLNRAPTPPPTSQPQKPQPHQVDEYDLQDGPVARRNKYGDVVYD